MSVTLFSSGTQAATVTTEHFLSSPNVAGKFVLHVDLVNMVANDVVELRVYKMVLTGGTARVVYFAQFAGVQPTEAMIAISEAVATTLTDATGLRFSLKQTFGTSRNFPWAVINEQDFTMLPAGGVVPGAANGLVIAGTNAPVTITGSGNALTLTSTGGNGQGLEANGNGTGIGIYAQGGATGVGLYVRGGGTSGEGFIADSPTSGTGFAVFAAAGTAMYLEAGGSDGMGIDAKGAGVGDGIRGLGGATGGSACHGISAEGGAAGGSGFNAQGYGGNAEGITAIAIGTAAGLVAKGGATGIGIKGEGGNTSGAGAAFLATAGNSDGLTATKQGTGKDINGRVTVVTLADTLTTYTGNTPQTGNNYTRLGAPAGASISADVAAAKSDTAAILVDTAEIGAAGAGLTAVPWNASWDAEVQSEATDALNAYDPPTKAELDAAQANVSVDEIQASAIADLFNTDSATTYGAAIAGSVVKEIADNAGGSALTEAGIADAVWDEAIAGHVGAGSTGEALGAAGSAGDPWITALPGAYGAGTAGKIIGDNINATVTSRSSQTSVDDLPTNAELATALGAADDAVLAAIPSAAVIADAVWDEDATAHQTQGTFGQAIGDPVADTGTLFKATVTDATGVTVGADTATLLTRLGTPSDLGGGATVAGNLADIEAQTDDIGIAGAGLTNIDLPDQTMNITGNITGNVSGSVGSVTAGVTLAASAVQAIWDALTSALTTVGSIGKLLVDNINATISSRASQTSVDDVPTNAELATALGTADDETLAAIAALNNLSQANVRTALGLASANLDTQLDALPTTAELSTALGTADDAILAAIAALNNVSAAQLAALFTTAMTESYASDGAAPTPAQALFLIQQRLTEFAISATSITVKKLDGSTTAAVLTTDDATSPTSSTRSA